MESEDPPWIIMGCVRILERPWFHLLFFGLLVLATRYPQAPGQLFTFDDVNLAYSVGHFDVRISQPQPPGYPLFVLEMRVLRWLRFRRVESILLVLALAGSIAALVLLAMFGKEFYGGLAGFFASCLLVLHTVFWHSGITSALRVQLALISTAVAWSCWRAWCGERVWVLRSAVVLGLCAGVRPEVGPLLLPMWAVSAWRCARKGKLRQTTKNDRLPHVGSHLAWALGAMAAAVLLWLLPAMMASGGPLAYIKANLDYISDQASVSSGIFGAAPEKWQTTFWRLMTWMFAGLLSWTLPAVLAWKRKGGWAVDRERLAFLAWWLLPPMIFALTVHVEDPGQSLAMAPPIALLGGYLFDRALRNWTERVSRWTTVILVASALWIYWLIEFRDTTTVVVWTPLIALLAGVALKYAQVPNAGWMPPVAAMAFLLTPLAIVQLGLFQNPGWYYKGTATSGATAAAELTLADINTGLALTSFSHIRNTLAVDDHSLREAIRLAGERPGKTIVVWEQGLVSWRKAAYYMRDVPVVVLDHQRIRSGTPPVIAIWRGPQGGPQRPSEMNPAFRAPAGGRIVWLVNPKTPFYNVVTQAFPVTAAGPIYYTDLPMESGSRPLGEYGVEW